MHKALRIYSAAFTLTLAVALVHGQPSKILTREEIVSACRKNESAFKSAKANIIRRQTVGANATLVKWSRAVDKVQSYTWAFKEGGKYFQDEAPGGPNEQVLTICDGKREQFLNLPHGRGNFHNAQAWIRSLSGLQASFNPLWGSYLFAGHEISELAAKPDTQIKVGPTDSRYGPTIVLTGTLDDPFKRAFSIQLAPRLGYIGLGYTVDIKKGITEQVVTVKSLVRRDNLWLAEEVEQVFRPIGESDLSQAVTINITAKFTDINAVGDKQFELIKLLPGSDLWDLDENRYYKIMPDGSRKLNEPWRGEQREFQKKE